MAQPQRGAHDNRLRIKSLWQFEVCHEVHKGVLVVQMLAKSRRGEDKKRSSTLCNVGEKDFGWIVHDNAHTTILKSGDYLLLESCYVHLEPGK